MDIDGLLNEMFPGEAAKGFPSFGDLGIDLGLWIQTKTAKAITAGLDQLELRPETDVNEVLRMLRRVDPEATQRFVGAALEAYFSAPRVGQMLNGGMHTLFPNARALPDIDINLLLPVFEGKKEESDRE